MSLFQDLGYGVTIAAPITPAVVTYTSGQVIATPVTITGWARGAKVATLLHRVRVVDPQALNPALTLYLFNKQPVSPFTVSGAFASQIVAGDLANLIDVVKVAAGAGVDTGVAFSGIGSYQIVNMNPNKMVPAISAPTNPAIYVVAVAAASIVSAAATAFTVYFDLLRS